MFSLQVSKLFLFATSTMSLLLDYLMLMLAIAASINV